MNIEDVIDQEFNSYSLDSEMTINELEFVPVKKVKK